MREDLKLAADIRTLIGSADPARANRNAGAPSVIRVAEPALIMTGPRIPEQQRRRQLRRLRLAVAAAAAFAVAVAAGAVAVGHIRDAAVRPAQATPQMLRYVLAGYKDPIASSTLPPANPELEQLAAIAARQPQPQGRTGAQIGYVETEEWNLSVAVAGGTSVAVVAPQLDQTWTSPAGEATQKQTYGKAQDLSRASEPSQLVQAAEYEPSGTSTQSFPTNQMFGPLVSGLSAQPDQLQAQLVEATSPYGPYRSSDWPLSYYLINEITAVQHQIVSPQLESAFWQVLATRSDIRYMGLVTDRAGRPGEAFGLDAFGVERLVLIISPTTGLLLGEEDLDLSNPGALTIKTYPAVIGAVTYLSQGYVANVGK